MIEYTWCVIDTQLDRPFFSSSPPPSTLKRTPGMKVLRFETEVPEPHEGVVILGVTSKANVRLIAQEIFDLTKESVKKDP